MKVSEFINQHHSEAVYTVKIKRKTYLCTSLEAALYYGEKVIKKVIFKKGKDDLTVLYLLDK